jgi:hypothetical protein
MKTDARGIEGFTLVELLVGIATLGILAALLFPLLNETGGKGRRAICVANVKQISQGVMMYAADNHDILFPCLKKPDSVQGEVIYFQEWTAYVPMVGPYVGWNGDPSPHDKVFACPADTFHSEADSNRMTYWANQSLHSGSNVNYSSYIFNAANVVFQGPARDKFPTMFPGVLGSRLSSISTPGRTVLLGEGSAWDAYSWHSPHRPRQFSFNNALDMLGFADGHVSYLKIYLGHADNPCRPVGAFTFDPPAGYDYQWSAN